TTIFEKGCSGHSLDVKAREIMWKEGLDYKCGTGHGVGYMSCVHEGPIGFRFYDRPNRLGNGELKPGHIITVEPGVYKPHKYGIRLENNLLVKEAFTTSDGIFYSFETITYFPYDRRGIDLSLLTDEELQWLNDYHKMTEEVLKPLCPRELLSLLEDLCKEIKR
ncbi:MAG: M24 family metallopeptidase C-terminal domain-containing protein, partial [Bacilli bacterium]|nr:M24 family metallopeptidase C-terminal domain-containing protein [Bacilli bacterium]